jgi:uridine kinase
MYSLSVYRVSCIMNCSNIYLGLKSLLISMDDYYHDPEDVPSFPDGKPDYDCVESVNISLLADRVKRLINGEEVPVRKFDFFTSRGKDLPNKTIKLAENCAVLMEGIHGLNPKLSDSFGGKDAVHSIYVSALTHLNIDDSHHISTSDNRLLRRIMRDYRTRGYSATRTLQVWGVVRAAEERHIFPFQEYADFVLNTALVYELPVLANYVKPLLAEVSGDAAAEEEAERLLRFLNLFYPMTDEYVPKNSLLREFCGGSTFSY